MLKDAYTTREIASILGMAPKNVLTRADREGWDERPRAGRGGGKEWLANDKMPETTRAELAAALAANLPAPAQSRIAAAPDLVVPDYAWNRGKARLRIVQEWRAAVAKGKTRGKRSGETTREFIASANAGLILPAQVIQDAGGLTQPTLYRWAKILKDSHNDPESLADRRGGWTRGAPKGLGQISIEAEQAFLGVYLRDTRPSLEFAYRAMESVLIDKELPVPSSATVRRFFRRFDEMHHDVVVWMREGEKAYNDTVGKFLSRNREILEVGDVLVADGHKINFTAIDPKTGKEARFTLIGWQDMKSTMFLGFDLMNNENTQAIASSFFHSILNLGKLPGCVYIDNGKAFKNKFFDGSTDLSEMDGLYTRLGVKVMHSQPYQARSKPVERWWRDFDQQCAVGLDTHVGRNVEDKPAHMKMGEKWHRKRHGDLAVIPTLEDVKRIIIEFARWKAMQPHPFIPGTTPWEVFQAGRGPGFSAEETARLARQFLHRKHVHPKRCRFPLHGIEFESDELHGLNMKLEAHYSPADMSRVYLHNKGAFVCIARPIATVHPMATLYGNALDLETVKAAQKQQAKMRSGTRKLAAEMSRQYGPSGAEALESLPFMLSASERKRPLTLHQGVDTDNGRPALEASRETVISDQERAELEAIAEATRVRASSPPAYEAPSFFSSRLERYDFLFEVAFGRGLTLLPDDAAFMAEFENSPDYEVARPRYDQLKAFFRKRKEKTA